MIERFTNKTTAAILARLHQAVDQNALAMPWDANIDAITFHPSVTDMLHPFSTLVIEKMEREITLQMVVANDGESPFDVLPEGALHIIYHGTSKQALSDLEQRLLAFHERKYLTIGDIHDVELTAHLLRKNVITHIIPDWPEAGEIQHGFVDRGLQLAWTSFHAPLPDLYASVPGDWFDAQGIAEEERWNYFVTYMVDSAVAAACRVYPTVLRFYNSFFDERKMEIVEQLISAGKPEAEHMLLTSWLESTGWWWKKHMGETSYPVPAPDPAWLEQWVAQHPELQLTKFEDEIDVPYPDALQSEVDIADTEYHGLLHVQAKKPVPITISWEQQDPGDEQSEVLEVAAKLPIDEKTALRLMHFEWEVSRAWMKFVSEQQRKGVATIDPAIIDGQKCFGVLEITNGIWGSSTMNDAYPVSLSLEALIHPEEAFGYLASQEEVSREQYLDAAITAVQRVYPHARYFIEKFIRNDLPVLEKNKK